MELPDRYIRRGEFSHLLRCFTGLLFRHYPSDLIQDLYTLLTAFSDLTILSPIARADASDLQADRQADMGKQTSYQLRHRRQGLCPACPMPAARGHSYCLTCLERKRLSQRERRRRLAEQGR